MSPILFFIPLLLSAQFAKADAVRGDSPPKVLADAFHQRMSFNTARFTVRYEERGLAPVPFTRNARQQFAGGAQLFVDLGNDDGILCVSRLSGAVPLGIGGMCLPVELVVDWAGGTLWSHS